MSTPQHTPNDWINGARNWAMWQDHATDAWDAAHTIAAWYDKPNHTTEHVHKLLKTALLEKRLRHEAEAATYDTGYYGRRLDEIEEAMTEAAKKIG